MKRFMAFIRNCEEGEKGTERALVARLRQFVENSDLSFYRIASRVGTSGGILSMWLAGTASPRAEELAAIKKTPSGLRNMLGVFCFALGIVVLAGGLLAG